MGISAVPATTWAADSYKETEKAAFAKMIEEFGADYAKSLSEMDTEEVKGNAEIKVSLEDGGKAILGMLSPVDISWLADASISGNVSMSDKSMTEFMDVNVNGTKICTIEYYFDTENSEIYMRIPELSDGYIKMNMEQMTQEAVEEADQELDSSFTTSLDLADSMNSYFSTLENLPEADLVTSILTRYTDIIFDNVADAENLLEHWKCLCLCNMSFQNAKLLTYISCNSFLCSRILSICNIIKNISSVTANIYRTTR